MNPLDLLVASEAARQIALWCTVIGWFSGAGIVVAFGWRRLTAPSRAEELLLMARAHQDERDRLVEHLSEARAQVREQLARADRMAQLYAEAKADTAARKGAA